MPDYVRDSCKRLSAHFREFRPHRWRHRARADSHTHTHHLTKADYPRHQRLDTRDHHHLQSISGASPTNTEKPICHFTAVLWLSNERREAGQRAHSNSTPRAPPLQASEAGYWRQWWHSVLIRSHSPSQNRDRRSPEWSTRPLRRCLEGEEMLIVLSPTSHRPPEAGIPPVSGLLLLGPYTELGSTGQSLRQETLRKVS